MIIRKAKRIAITTGVVGATAVFAVGGYTIYDSLTGHNQETVAEAQQPTVKELKQKHYKVRISNEDFGKVKEVAMLFGYSHTYNFTDNPFAKKLKYEGETKDSNIFKHGYKYVVNKGDKFLNEKSVKFDVRSMTLMGFDLSNLQIDDVKYDESTNTLYIKAPQLLMAVLTDYSNTDIDEGILVKILDSVQPEELDAFHKDAQNRIINEHSTDVVKKKAYELTTNKLADKLITKQEVSQKDKKDGKDKSRENLLSIEVDHVKFEPSDKPIRVLNDELEIGKIATENKVKNNTPKEVLEEAKEK